MPFVLGLLFFWADLSRDPDAETLAPWAALALTGLFLVMKTGQAVFAAGLRAGLLGETTDGVVGRRPWNVGRLGRLFLVQATLQPSGLVLLPLAAVTTLPLGWTYAFYQHLTTAGDDAHGSVRTALTRAGRLTRPWARQNHVALAVLSLVAIIVWVDGMAAVLLAPELVRMFTGTESVFTRSGPEVLLNTTFLAASVALTYAVLDPLAKAFYVLRGFYADARRTGEDLRRELRALPPVPVATSSRPPATAAVPVATKAAVVTFLLMVLVSSPGTMRAQPSSPAPSSTPVTASPALERSIEDVVRRREFAWRLPRGEQRRRLTAAPKESALTRWLKRIGDVVDRWVRWWRRLFERDRKDLGPEPVLPTSEPRDWLPGLLRPAAWTLIVLGAVAGVWLYLRARRAAKKTDPLAGTAAAGAAGPDPDAAELADEALLPTRLPEDEWLRLGRELRARGETRLALRAFYLSVLAGLAARELLAVARHKSNGDYLAEVRRRGRDHAGLPESFGAAVGLFERPWYGRHPADDPALDALLTRREEIIAHAGPVTPTPVPAVAGGLVGSQGRYKGDQSTAVTEEELAASRSPKIR